MLARGAKRRREMKTVAGTLPSVARRYTVISARSEQRGKRNSVAAIEVPAETGAARKEKLSNRLEDPFEREVVPEILIAIVADATPGLRQGEDSEMTLAHGHRLGVVTEMIPGAETGVGVLRVLTATFLEARPLDDPERRMIGTLGVEGTTKIEIDAADATIGLSYQILTAISLVAATAG